MSTPIIIALSIAVVFLCLVVYDKQFPAAVAKPEPKPEPKPDCEQDLREEAERANKYRAGFLNHQKKLPITVAKCKKATSEFYDALYDRIGKEVIQVKDGVLSFSFLDVTIALSDVLYVRNTGGGSLACRKVYDGDMDRFISHYESVYRRVKRKEKEKLAEIKRQESMTDKERSMDRFRSLSRHMPYFPSYFNPYPDDNKPCLLRTDQYTEDTSIVVACAEKTYTFKANPLISGQISRFFMDLHRDKFADKKLILSEGVRPEDMLQDPETMAYIIKDIIVEDTIKRDIDIRVPITNKIDVDARRSGYSSSSSDHSFSGSSSYGQSMIAGGVGMLLGLAIGH